VSRGAEGAMLRGGGLTLDVGGVPASVVDTSGAGDSLTATLLARLAASRFYAPTLAAALPEAVERAARACERYGAR
jgi:sugar/nucleoside kinase (ribokinase family)